MRILRGRVRAGHRGVAVDFAALRLYFLLANAHNYCAELVPRSLSAQTQVQDVSAVSGHWWLHFSPMEKSERASSIIYTVYGLRVHCIAAMVPFSVPWSVVFSHPFLVDLVASAVSSLCVV